MAERIYRKRRLTPSEIERVRSIRAEFAHHPSKGELIASGDYVGPMSLDEYLAWRDATSDAPLSKQLQAAIESCGQSVNSIAQASGVPQPVLQRFLNGDRGLTLNTAGKVAAYLGLALMPVAKSRS